MKKPPVVLILICTLFSCTVDNKDNAKISPSDSTIKMIKRLDAIISNQDPMLNQFRNVERLSFLQEITDATVSLDNINGLSKLANEQLRAGASHEAAENFNLILTLIHDNPELFDDFEQQKIRKKLAIAHLRTGEQANCVMLHGSESCLFPLSQAAVHLNQQGAKLAMQQWFSLLEHSPDDLQLQWLMNLTAQTLGQYPQNVPSQWLISMDHFISDIEMPAFNNKAPASKSNIIDIAGGSIVEDFNNDGFIDIMTSAWGHDSQIKVLVNDGRGQFTDHTHASGLSGLNGGLNLIAADYDNDGDVDVFVLRGAWLMNNGKLPNSLLQNDGHGFFSDITVSANLLSHHPTQTAAWGDFDNDGWLDLLIGNESIPGNRHPTELYHNNQDGTFTEVARKAKLNITGYVKGIVWGDYNNDGHVDIYVSRLGETNLLLRNDSDADIWRFTDVSLAAGVQEPLNSFPTWFWDYDNDGWQDIFVSDYNISSYRNLEDSTSQTALIIKGMTNAVGQKNLSRLYKNNRDGTFSDVSKILDINYPLLAMGANFEDIDNDGYLDMYIGTGEPDFATLIPNKMFYNNKGREFIDITTTSAVGHLQKGHAISFADFDNDGDQDIYAVMGGAYSGDQFQNALFENPGHGNHWLNIKLIGTQSNRSAIGAKVEANIISNGVTKRIHRVVGTGGSFGANSLSVHIGLQHSTSVDSLKITWPSGHVDSFDDIMANQFIQITENSSDVQILIRPEITL